MANVKISQLPPVSSVTGTDVLPVVATTTTSKLSITDLANSLPQVSSSISASHAITADTAAIATTATTALTASYVENAQTASYVVTALTASYVENAQTASYVVTALTASYVENAQTASYVENAQTASYVNPLVQGVQITGSLDIAGTLTVDDTLVVGNNNQVLGPWALVQGRSSIAYQTGSHAQGQETEAFGQYSHAEGYRTTTGEWAHAEGQQTNASGQYSHAEGNQTATGINANHAHAEGYGSVANAQYSHAEGFLTTVGGAADAAHTEGRSTTATGPHSHAEGNTTQAIGAHSHAEGSGSIARGAGSHAEGLWTIASGSAQHVTGKYNLKGNTTSIFVIGNGTGEGSRSDIMRVEQTAVQITGSVDATAGFSGSFSGSFEGDGSGLTGITVQAFPYVGKAEITGSLEVDGTGSAISFQGNNIMTAPFVFGQGYMGGASTFPDPYNGPVYPAFPMLWGGNTNVGSGGASGYSYLYEDKNIGHVVPLPDFNIPAGAIKFVRDAMNTSIGGGNPAGTARIPYFTIITNNANVAENSLSWGYVAANGRNHVLTVTGSILSKDGVSLGTSLSNIHYISGSVRVAGGVTGSFTGSFRGDGSGLTGISATVFPYVGTARITGSLIVSGSTTEILGGLLAGTTGNPLGVYAAVVGLNNNAIGDNSFAHGNATTAYSVNSHAQGFNTYAGAVGAHTEGINTSALGIYAHAEGSSVIALGNYSHAEGDSTTANGEASHAEGYFTSANGNYSHTEGRGAITAGGYSHAEGYNTVAFGDYSHAEGEGTIASGSAQLAAGKYNRRGNTTSLFVIGNGTGDLNANRSDILRVEQTSVQVSGSLLMSGSIIPDVAAGNFTSSFSLGSSTAAWKDIWVSNGTIYFLDGAGQQQGTLSTSANGLVMDGDLFVATSSISVVRVGKGTDSGGTSNEYSVLVGNGLQNNTTGIQNTAVGYNALRDNTTGYNNVAIGPDTLKQNINGDTNIGIGHRALENNRNGGSNIAIGFQAAQFATGSQNTVVGHYGLNNLGNGVSNVAVGFGAGQYASGSSNLNVYIGPDAGPSSNTEETSKLYIHNNSGKPLIGGDFTQREVRINGDLIVTGSFIAPTGIPASPATGSMYVEPAANKLWVYTGNSVTGWVTASLGI